MSHLTEFLSPYEDDLNVIIMGDNITPEFINDLQIEFNNTRSDIKGLGDISYHYFNTSDVFKNKINDLSKEDTADLDPLDIMLMERYIGSIFQEKFIFNITKVSDTLLETIIDAMDLEFYRFEYILTDDHLGIIIK
jgi:hypothetical protein